MPFQSETDNFILRQRTSSRRPTTVHNTSHRSQPFAITAYDYYCATFTWRNRLTLGVVPPYYSRFRVLILKRSRLTLPHARKTNSTGHSDLGRKGNLFSTILTIAGTGDNLRSKRYYGSSTVLDSSSSQALADVGYPLIFRCIHLALRASSKFPSMPLASLREDPLS